jgi:isoquinoline 1-oxidoreductase beta subunit
MDVNVPGMLTAAIKHAPFGGKVKSFDAAAAKRVKGVHDVFVVGGAVYPDNSAPALLCAADTYWQAVQGLKAANPVFERNGWEKLDSDLVTRTFQEGAKEKGKLARVQGDVNTALASAAKVIEVDYEVPYLSHSPMEPMTSAADVKADSCEIWAGTQGADPCYFMASKLTGLPLEKIKVHMTYAGGGFGRRFETDVAEQAIEASMKLKKPVKVIWSREEDTQHDYNRPAFFGRITAGVDEKGNVVAWRYNTVGPAIWLSPYQSTRAKDLDAESDFMKGMRQTGVDFHSVQGAKDIGYAFPNLEVTYVQKDFPVPIAFYRAVGNTQHAFFVESALDEIAQATGQDPYQLRRKLLAKEPRMLGVLDLAAQKAGWGQPLPAGRFRGIAFHNSFDSPVADVIEISVRGGKRIQVHRVVRAIDCGIVVNPDQLQAQFQGGLAWGLTTAMYSELTLKNGEVVQSNFHDYKMLRISQMPVFEAYAVPSQANPTGIGEPVAVSVAPALANAVFAATGKRIRSLPLAKHGFSLA